jgi:hypothetical protein
VRADLRDAVVAAGGFDHAAAFVNGDRQRLFAINVFAGVAGGNGLNCVPVVRRGDDHGIEISPLEQLAEVAIGLSLASELFVGPGQIRLEDVAQRDDVHIAVFEKRVEQLRAAVAHADETEADAFVYSQGAGRRGGQGQRGCCRGGGKRSAANRHRFHKSPGNNEMDSTIILTLARFRGNATVT